MTARLRSLTRTLGVLLVVLAAAGCQDGYLVDASDPHERGEGGLAFVLMVVMIVVFVFTLFFMDRIRRRRMEPEGEEES